VDIPADEGPLTIAAAAARLGVTRQRVSQMLTSGELEGPSTGPGRAPKEAGRVWGWSLDLAVQRRELASSQPTEGASHDVAHLATRLADLERTVAELVTRGTGPTDFFAGRERAARQAAMSLKVQADFAHDELSMETARAAALEAEVAALKARVRELETKRDRDAALHDAYRDALTSLLSADSPDEVR